jgi:hypothetical protein
MCEYVTHVEWNILIYSIIKVKLLQLQTHIHQEGFVWPRSMARRSSSTPLSYMLLFAFLLWKIFVNHLTMSILFPSTYFLWCLYMLSPSFPFIFRRFPAAAALRFSHTIHSLRAPFLSHNPFTPKQVRPLQVHETSMGPTRRWVRRLIFSSDWGCRLYSWRRGAMFQVWSKFCVFEQ